MTSFPITLSPGNLDMLKKLLTACARHTRTLFIKESKVSQQIHQNVWLRIDLTSILGENVDMSILLDSKVLKQLKHVKCQNDDAVISFENDRYRVADGMAAASIVYLPPISLTHANPPPAHQLSPMGTVTPLYEDTLGKVLAVCKDSGPVVLFFDEAEELYAIANRHRTSIHLVPSDVVAGSKDNVKSGCLLLSNVLDKVECAGLELSAFKESFSGESVNGRLAYWLLVKMNIALGVNIELFEQVQPLPKIIQENYLKSSV